MFFTVSKKKLMLTLPLRIAKATTNFFRQFSPFDSKGSSPFEDRLQNLTSLDAMSAALTAHKLAKAKTTLKASEVIAEYQRCPVQFLFYACVQNF